ncbi:uncharacterized protein N7483_008386 [Penicillium malachiteum]|uniref:uncharacterized protein n=1 Tax=Penicillium malachiteum TaxID=1324776 RepID=UPI00254665A5|nr:uncharacterized protein N7483_008386 [Penicillium malachiteum]KAJ5720452.1 hypothetical protein N7483_008386 [Penicillium malachiteum]
MDTFNYLVSRGSISNYLTNETCPMPKKLNEVEEPFLGNMTFYHFNIIVSGACTLITCILIFTLQMQHATHFSVPCEQIKIMRIVHMLPAFSLTSLFAIIFPNSYVYLEGWTEVFQAIALYSFHMLLIDFLAPSEKQRDIFFENFKVKKSFKKGQYREGLSWLKLSYYCTLQYPIVVFLVAIGQSIAQAFNVYCLDSNKPGFAHIWLELLQEVSVTIAINAVIRFYANTKDYMKEHKPLLKLLSFKLIVGLIFLEQIIFMVLESSSIFKPTKKLSYADVHMGLPTMVICVQMVPFAIFMHFSFNKKPYIVKQSGQNFEMVPEADEKGRPIPRSYQGGPGGLHAWLAYMNPMEYYAEMKSMYRTLHHVHVRNQKPIYEADLKTEASSNTSAPVVNSELEQHTEYPSPEPYEPIQSQQTHYAHPAPYEQAQFEQSQPLINQAEYPTQPAQTHYPAQAAEQAHQYYQAGMQQTHSSYSTQPYDQNHEQSQMLNQQHQHTEYNQTQYGHQHQFGESNYDGRPYS